ncbi:hypothetical protein F4810DRAFT_684817, partial [Camillea tinctor]
MHVLFLFIVSYYFVYTGGKNLAYCSMLCPLFLSRNTYSRQFFFFFFFFFFFL